MFSNLGSLGSRRRRSAAHGILSGFGAVPSQWTIDSRVKALQSALNSQMSAVGCGTTLKADGLIGPMTCGAMAWSKATGSAPAAYTSYAGDMDAGCRSITAKAPACPTAVVPGGAQPVPVAVPAAPPAIVTTGPIIVPGAPHAPAVPVVVPGSTPGSMGPPEAVTLPPSTTPRGGLNMKTVAIVGGAVVAVGLGAFLLLGKKKPSAPAKAA